MTVFGCADAHGVVTYNGVGSDDNGVTPSNWLMELATQENLFNYTFPEVLAEVRIEPNRTIASRTLSEELLKTQDAVIFAANLANFDWNWVIRSSALIIDAIGITQNFSMQQGQVVRV